MSKIFIITGEHSGDIHAAHAVRELRALRPDVEIEGVGGENLAAEGVKLFSDHKKMGQVGITPKIVFDHLTLGRRIVDYLTKVYKPDLVLLVDYGAFNLSISKFLHRAGIKTFYYIPPQVWASRKWRLKTIKKNIDKVLCIFPFEQKLYEQNGIDVHYCGHPLAAQLPAAADRQEFFARHGLDPDKKLVSIFPGSRVFELKHLMELFMKSARELQAKHPELQFCISQAPNLSDETFKGILRSAQDDMLRHSERSEESLKIIKGDNHALLSVSDSLILASGTVALEAALYQTPMLIAYKGPVLFYLIYLMVVCTKFVSLPNIITGKLIVPELLQFGANENAIVSTTEKLLYDENYRSEHIAQLGQVRALISEKNSAKEVATIVNNSLG